MMTSILYTSKRMLPRASTYAEIPHSDVYTFPFETHVDA